MSWFDWLSIAPLNNFPGLTFGVAAWILIYIMVAVYVGINAWNALGDVLYCRIMGIKNGVFVQFFGNLIIECLTFIVASIYLLVGAYAVLGLPHPSDLHSRKQYGDLIILLFLLGAILKLIRSYVGRRIRQAIGAAFGDGTRTYVRQYISMRMHGTLPKNFYKSVDVENQLEKHMKEISDNLEKNGTAPQKN